MKGIFLKTYPLNIFQILGTACCARMTEEFAKKNLSKHFFCYDAPSFFNANVLVIWGSISQKLNQDIANASPFLLQPNGIIHIQGCEKRVDNLHASSSLLTKADHVMSLCHPHPNELITIFKEIRSCFKA